MNVGTQDVALSVSAAGTTQATATLLINGINQITTAAASSGVILFGNPTVGMSQMVYNAGANAVRVYPPVGAQINGIGTNNPHILSTNTSCVYWFLSSTQVAGNLSA